MAAATLGACDSHSEPPAPTEAVADDTVQAEVALLKAAEAGDVESQYRQGIALVRRARISDGVAWLRKAAESGHAEAAFELSQWDSNGEIHWIRMAAERGHAEAQYAYANHLSLGHLIDKDPVEATKWFRMSAEQGYAEAQFRIGENYLGGVGVPKDRQAAVSWFEQAAARNHHGAQYDLALLMHEDGKLDVAYQWASRAAEGQHAPAQYILALMFADGLGVAADPVQACVWIELAAAQGEKDAIAERQSFVDQVPPARLPEAWHRLGMAYIQAEGIDQDYAKACEWLLKSAEAGYAPAQHRLGVLAREGVPGAPRNLEDAERWLLAAARQGHAEAQLDLGSAYKWGWVLGDAPNPVEARKWLLAAAESESAQACLELGHMYYDSEFGLGQDLAEAVRWYLRAAEAGDLFAYMMLAQLHAEPDTSVHDPVQAYYWFGRAVADGVEMAAEHLAKLESTMTPEQRSRAKQLLADRAPPGPQRAEPASDSTAVSREPVENVDGSPAGPQTSEAARGASGSNSVLEAQQRRVAANAEKQAAQAAHEAALAHLAALKEKDAALKAKLEGLDASAGQSAGPTSDTAAAWAERFRNARPVNSADLLSDLKTANFHIRVGTPPSIWAPFTRLPAMETNAIRELVAARFRAHGISHDPNAAHTLEIRMEWAGKLKTTESNGIVKNEDRIYTAYFEAGIPVRAPVYRGGDFHLLEFRPVVCSSFKTITGRVTRDSFAASVQESVDFTVNHFRNAEVRRPDPTEIPALPRDATLTESLHGAYIKALERRRLDPVFAETTAVRPVVLDLGGVLESSANQSLASEWRSELRTLGLNYDPDSRLWIRHFAHSHKEAINPGAGMILGGFALQFHAAYNHIVVSERGVVFPWNNDLVIADVRHLSYHNHEPFDQRLERYDPVAYARAAIAACVDLCRRERGFGRN